MKNKLDKFIECLFTIIVIIEVVIVVILANIALFKAFYEAIQDGGETAIIVQENGGDLYDT